MIRATVRAALCLVGLGGACTAAKQEAAEVTYLGQHLTCVDEAKTLEQSKACRMRVDQRWGRWDAGPLPAPKLMPVEEVYGPAPDGGRDGTR